MESNTSSKQGEILPVTLVKELEFNSTGFLLIQKDKLAHFTFENFSFIFNKSGVQKFFLILSNLIVVFPFRTGKRRTYFQKHLINF